MYEIQTPHTAPARTRQDRRARQAMTVERGTAGITVRTPYVDGDTVLMVRASDQYADIIARRVSPGVRLSHRYEARGGAYAGMVHVYAHVVGEWS